MRITVIGCGNIGFAIIQALLERGVTTPDELSVVQRSETRTVFLRESLSCNVSRSPSPCIGESEVVLIAVKPQDFALAASQIQPFISKDQLIISVMAGVTIAAMQQLIPATTQFIRTMPNLPARIARAITPYFAEAAVWSENIAKSERILLSFGSALRLHREHDVDAATAISGSGPTYLYLFVESLLEAAQSVGLSASESRLLVHDMISGSLELWTRNLDDLRALRDAPRSKAGTTEAAFKVLTEQNFSDAVIKAVQAAHARARELSQIVSGTKL